MSTQNPYEEEKVQLDHTLTTMKEHLEKLEAMPKYVGNNYTEQVLEGIREKNRTDLRRAMREPYFGRLDFREEGEKGAVPLYIGKIGVANPANEQPMIIDWRAPVASLFYSFIGGNETAYYESTDGRIEGNVHLKRYIVVRNGELQRVVDDFEKGNERVADDFLLYRLGENKDNRLKDIVSTIQVEQNEIIRAPRNTPILIQGVAGSGKTTVALHRLAYLIYQYQESLRAQKMIIFAPNRLFLDYISDVLPELGVGDIQQTTFQDWAMSILEDEVRLKDARESFAKWFESDSMVEEGKTKRWKGSLSFMHALVQYIKSYEKDCVPTQDFEAWERKKLDKTIINRWFTIEYKHYPLAKRRERILHRIKAWMDGELKHIGDPQVKKDRKKKATQQLNAYLKYWPNHTALSFYRELFSKLKKKREIPEDILRQIPSDVVQATTASLKKKEMEQEDLAPLVFIHQSLYGVDTKYQYQHVVIDEAQDYSPFQLALLKNRIEQQSLTILGDLSQSIYAHQGILNWDEFKTMFDKTKLQYFELTKSYRSTWEIIRFANEIISQAHLSIQLADPVFRSGEKIKMVRVAEESRISSIINAVLLLQEKRMNTIALMGRTEAECEALYTDLTAAGIPVSLVQAEQENYAGGISIIPVYLSKGLEFDAVLLLDVNDQAYRNTVQDAKLLYVGCTRALHELWLFHAESPSPLLEGIDEEFVMNLKNV